MKHIIHDHPKLQQRLGLPLDHVIVDRESYDKARAGESEIAELPAGYVKTGMRDGHVVCCLDKDFVRFTGGITGDLGFVCVHGRLVPLVEYKAAEAAEGGE